MIARAAPRRMHPMEVATPAERLCLSCGLCCDGSLYVSTTLRPEEVAVMTRLGVPVIARGGDHLMPQPCAALVDLACRAYRERPRRCVSYRCKQLVALEVGRRTLGQAQATVALAKTLEGAQREQFLDYHFRHPVPAS